MMISKASSFALRRPNPKIGFSACDMSDVAYVKPIAVGGRTYQAIVAADGTLLSVTAGRDTAFALVRKNNMKPSSVH